MEKITKKYRVLLSPYPEEFFVEATSEIDALDQAKNTFERAVWESEVELVEDETTN